MATGKNMTRLRIFRRFFVVTYVALVGLGLLGVAGCRPEASDESASATQAVVINNRAFTLELALDEDTRRQGLSDRAEIAENGGMLFVFPQARPLQFVMRRCLTPIDIVFLGPNGRVVSTHTMAVEPYDTPEAELTRYGGRYAGQFALEFRGGTLEQLDLSPGDAVDLPLESLKARAR